MNWCQEKLDPNWTGAYYGHTVNYNFYTGRFTELICDEPNTISPYYIYIIEYFNRCGIKLVQDDQKVLSSYRVLHQEMCDTVTLPPHRNDMCFSLRSFKGCISKVTMKFKESSVNIGGCIDKVTQQFNGINFSTSGDGVLFHTIDHHEHTCTFHIGILDTFYNMNVIDNWIICIHFTEDCPRLFEIMFSCDAKTLDVDTYNRAT